MMVSSFDLKQGTEPKCRALEALGGPYHIFGPEYHIYGGGLF